MPNCPHPTNIPVFDCCGVITPEPIGRKLTVEIMTYDTGVTHECEWLAIFTPYADTFVRAYDMTQIPLGYRRLMQMVWGNPNWFMQDTLGIASQNIISVGCSRGAFPVYPIVRALERVHITSGPDPTPCLRFWETWPIFTFSNLSLPIDYTAPLPADSCWETDSEIYFRGWSTMATGCSLAP